MQKKFYLLLATQTILALSTSLRTQLQTEMITLAIDDVLLQRRLRMLSQLAQLESQSLIKLRNFDTDQLDDYRQGVLRVLEDFATCVNRNG